MRKRLWVMILAGVMAMVDAGIGAGAEVWTEVAVHAGLPTATVDVTPTTATVSVAFSDVSSATVYGTFVGGIKALGFDQTHEQEAYFAFRVPSGAGQIRPEVVFAITGTGTTTGVVAWGIEYIAVSASLPLTTSGLSNTSRKVGCGQVDATPLGKLDASGSVYVVGRLYRDAGASADTLAKTVYLVGFGFWRGE